MTIMILKVTMVILLILKKKFVYLFLVSKHFFMVKKAYQLISIYLKFFSSIVITYCVFDAVLFSI